MSGYGTQPFTGINQKPLVFAQIRQGVSAPEVSKARVVESARVIDISSNRFLHLFYRKPYMSDMGYDHGLDGLATFRVKTAPDARVNLVKSEILAAGPFDVGENKSVVLSERQFLTMSDCSSWEFKPSVKVADFFANSLGVPIECWTPCSRIQMGRELEEADLIKFELECGAGESQDCAMTAGELALALNEGDASDFDPFDDLHGLVQLSVLFVNAHPDIQPLDFRLRINIKRCECEPMCFVHATTGKVHNVNNGQELKAGELARLGYNQTCLGFTVAKSDGSTYTGAMKYSLFGSTPAAAMDYEVTLAKDADGGDAAVEFKAERLKETNVSLPADDDTDKVLGMTEKMAYTDVWCTRAGELIGVSRGQEAEDDKGAKHPLFELDNAGTGVLTASARSDDTTEFHTAVGVAMEADDFGAYFRGDDDDAKPVVNAARKHWRDHYHYAGEASNWWGSKTETVQLDETLSFSVIDNGNQVSNDGTASITKGEQILGISVATSAKGTLVDTSVMGDQSLSLPEAVAERLL